MARVAYREADVDLMARMMRAEAEGEGVQGMLYVGNVIVNRAVADCLDFSDLRTIEDVIFQVQGEISLLKRFKKAMYFIKGRGKKKKD
uniref:hypothetical protein n=1 Tax=Phytohabitans flavus TaxID=1076124 RepID=UPI00366AEA72